jgi:hypothetical protein
MKQHCLLGIDTAEENWSNENQNIQKHWFYGLCQSPGILSS